MMAAIQSSLLTPRDMTSLANLKSHGLQLVEIKLSEFSPVVGRHLPSVVMSDLSRVVCIARQGRPILELDAVFLESGDVVYLLTDDVESVRATFTVLH